MTTTFEQLLKANKRCTVAVLEEHEDHVDISVYVEGSDEVKDFAVSGNQVTAYEDQPGLEHAGDRFPCRVQSQWCEVKQIIMVRAKFVVSNIQKNDDGSINVNAHPVHSGSEENKQFNDYTPGGNLQLHIAAGKPAQEQFIEGREYYVDFSLVEEQPDWQSLRFETGAGARQQCLQLNLIKMEVTAKIQNLTEALKNAFPNGKTTGGINSAKVYTESINSGQVFALSNLQSDNEMQVKIYRSGTGMTIFFTEDQEVEQTTNYEQFKDIASNREVDYRHVNKLAKAIAKKNLLHLNPILCNEKLEVIDGQHRLEAAKFLNVPVFYITDGSVSKADIADINSNAKNWSIIDYINYWAVEKRPGFDKLCAFLGEYPLIQPTTAMLLLSCDCTRDTNALKEGIVDVSNYDRAVEVANTLKWFRNFFEYAYDRNFILAINVFVNHPNFDLEIMKGKVDLQPRSVVRCINKKQYVEMLLEIYNYKSSKNRLSL